MPDQATATTPSIDISSVKPADIILTRNQGAQSQVIRSGSCSTYSHAILALENGDCIEATGAGVDIIPLKQALSYSNHGSLYRHIAIDANYGAWICHYAKEQRGKPYDYGGALRSGVATGCQMMTGSKIGLIIQLVDDLSKQGEHNDSFFCSELIVYAFEKGCLPLVRGGAEMASPGGIARSPYLKFIQDVVV